MHKNICYREELDNYIVHFKRGKHKFWKNVSTLDDALNLRAKALNFYHKHGRFPTNEEIGLKRRKPRLRPRPPKEVYVCSRCGDERLYEGRQQRQRFFDRGNLCGYCHRALESINSTESNSALNEKYISTENRAHDKHIYRLSIVFKDDRYNRGYLTLEKAVDHRDKLIKFFKDHDRLPKGDEYFEVLGPDFVSHQYMQEENLNTDAPTGQKYITQGKKSEVYIVQISRNKQKFMSGRKKLEDAIDLRDRVLAYYDEHKKLPTNKELKKLRKEHSYNEKHLI